MTKFHKLVRDKIPDIIRENGEIPKFHVIKDDKEYLEALLDKDVEESAELAQDQNLAELADKLEVLYAIATALGYSPDQVEQARAEKAVERGGFSRRIFLESTE